MVSERCTRNPVFFCCFDSRKAVFDSFYGFLHGSFGSSRHIDDSESNSIGFEAFGAKMAELRVVVVCRLDGTCRCFGVVVGRGGVWSML